jgi:hypothetical protein
LSAGQRLFQLVRDDDCFRNGIAWQKQFVYATGGYGVANFTFVGPEANGM